MDGRNSKLPETCGYITCDGIKLHYLIEGEGIPCLPVGMISNQIQPAFSSELKKHLKFIFIDTRAFVIGIR